MTQATARRSVFTFDGEGWPWFEGITFGDTWNGWCNPWFDAYVLAALAGEWAAYNATTWADEAPIGGPSEWVTFTFGSGGVVTLNRAWNSNAAPFEVDTLPTVEVDGVTYYGLTNGWCWLEPGTYGVEALEGERVIRSPRSTGERPARPAAPEGTHGAMLLENYAPAGDDARRRPCPRCGGWGMVDVDA